MSLKSVDLNGKVETLSFDIISPIIAKKTNKQSMFEQIVAENAGARQATVSTKTRAEVRGGGKKPRPQKHTGRAQLGSTRASHCVGGGNAFGPKPNRNYRLYLNKQAAHLALKSAFKEKEDYLYILENTNITKPSSRIIKILLEKLEILTKKVLFIGNDNKNLINSAKNISRVCAKN
jgi:large subunit ribosomal protein L4